MVSMDPLRTNSLLMNLNQEQIRSECRLDSSSTCELDTKKQNFHIECHQLMICFRWLPLSRSLYQVSVWQNGTFIANFSNLPRCQIWSKSRYLIRLLSVWKMNIIKSNQVHNQWRKSNATHANLVILSCWRCDVSYQCRTHRIQAMGE